MSHLHQALTSPWRDMLSFYSMLCTRRDQLLPLGSKCSEFAMIHTFPSSCSDNCTRNLPHKNTTKRSKIFGRQKKEFLLLFSTRFLPRFFRAVWLCYALYPRYVRIKPKQDKMGDPFWIDLYGSSAAKGECHYIGITSLLESHTISLYR